MDIQSNPLAEETNLLERFQYDVEVAGLVGEQRNAAIVLQCAVSARLEKPIHLTVQGSSAAGKNHLIGTVARFLPPGMHKFITGMTPKTLMYAEENEYQHQAVFIAEYEGVSGADYAIRTMQSERVIEWDYVDKKDGRLVKGHNTVNGPAAFIQATTRVTLHPENETRLLFIQMDESPEQTAAITFRQAQNAANGSTEPPPELFTSWHAFIDTLTCTRVRILFAPKLAEMFSSAQVRARRDFPKLLGLIEVSAYLHQHQRQKEGNLVIASSDDYKVAKELFEHSYGAGSEKAVAELVGAAARLESEFSVGHLMRELGWKKTKTYETLQRAEEHGFVAPGDSWGKYMFVRAADASCLELPDSIPAS